MTFIETPSGRGLRPTASISCRRIAGAKVLRAAAFTGMGGGLGVVREKVVDSG